MANPNCFPEECFTIFKPSTPYQPCPKGTSCIKLGTISVYPKDAPNCQSSGFVNFECFDFSGCASDIIFTPITILGEQGVSSYSFDQDKFTFTRSDVHVDKFSITFKACCQNEDDCKICDFGCIEIYFPNKCSDVPTDCVCNPCNGEYICTEGETYPHSDGPSFPTTTTTSCTSPIVYNIEYYDPLYFTNVVIDSSGNISYDLVCSELLKTEFISDIGYSASACGATDQSVETIKFTPLCNEVTCPENHKCNYCTGVCEELPCPEVTTGTDTGEYSNLGSCVTDKGVTPIMLTEEKVVTFKTSGKDVCYTDITPVAEPPEPVDPCVALLEAVKDPCSLKCMTCKVVEGKACLETIEEQFDLSLLDDVCKNQTIELTGSCCTKKVFSGNKTETWNNQDDTVCLGDPYTVIGSCGTPKQFIGTQVETWDESGLGDICQGQPVSLRSNCGNYRTFYGIKIETFPPDPDTSNVCPNQVVRTIGDCGTIKEYPGTLQEVFPTLKPEILSAVCIGTFIPCVGSCGTTQNVEGTKDCGVIVDPCAGVTCQAGYICNNGNCVCNTPNTDWSPTAVNTCPNDTLVQTRTINCQTETRTVYGTSTDPSCSPDLCANNTCANQNYQDGEIVCEAPNNDIIVSFVQHTFTCDPSTGNCIETTQTVSTGNTCPGCTVTSWTPDPSAVCEGEVFTQTSNCGTTRTATGTLTGQELSNCLECVNGVVSSYCTNEQTCDGNGNCIDICDPSCSGPQCGQDDGCGGTCPDTDNVCPDLSTIACGIVYQNLCGVNCGTGTGPNPNQCPDPATVPCGDTVVDNCGNSCGFTGTQGCTAPCTDPCFTENGTTNPCTTLIPNDCPDPSTIPCGLTITSPSGCHMCTGTGTLCNTGSCQSGTCFDCPNGVTIGDPCDDGNVCTTGETVQADCSCGGGQPKCPSSCQDCDASGNCVDNCPDNFGCDPVADGCVCLIVGDPCDDGDPCTINTIVQSDCSCGGGTTVEIDLTLDVCISDSGYLHVSGSWTTNSPSTNVTLTVDNGGMGTNLTGTQVIDTVNQTFCDNTMDSAGVTTVSITLSIGGCRETVIITPDAGTTPPCGSDPKCN